MASDGAVVRGRSRNDRAASELGWFFNEAAAESGDHAASLVSSGSKVVDPWSIAPTDAQLRAVTKAGEIRAALLRMPPGPRDVLATMYSSHPGWRVESFDEIIVTRAHGGRSVHRHVRSLRTTSGWSTPVRHAFGELVHVVLRVEVAANGDHLRAVDRLERVASSQPKGVRDRLAVARGLVDLAIDDYCAARWPVAGTHAPAA